MDYSKPAADQKSPPPYAGHPPAVGMPVPHAHGGGVPGPWSSGLCGCFSDVPNCCMTFWCPCVTFGQIAEIVDKGTTSCGTSGALYALILLVTGCSCIYSFFYRQKMRKQFMLSETPCNDFIIHCCCEYCALCQEFRELKHRGFDMSLGWQGNVDNQTRGATTAPVVEGGMTR